MWLLETLLLALYQLLDNFVTDLLLQFWLLAGLCVLFRLYLLVSFSLPFLLLLNLLDLIQSDLSLPYHTCQIGKNGPECIRRLVLVPTIIIGTIQVFLLQLVIQIFGAPLRVLKILLGFLQILRDLVVWV